MADGATRRLASAVRRYVTEAHGKWADWEEEDLEPWGNVSVMQAREVMTAPVVTASPDTPVKDVAALLVDHGISGVPIVGKAGKLMGLVSEADLMALGPDPRARRRPTAAGPAATTVAEVMVRDVITATEDADVASLARLLLRENVKRVPILRGGRVVGIVSRRDLIRILARADDEIRERVTELLRSDERTERARCDSVENGIVTLSGLPEPIQRHAAVAMVQAVPGVNGIVLADL